MFLLDPEDTMEFYDAQRRANMAAKGEPSVEEQWVLKKLFCKNVHGEIPISIFNSQNHLKSKVAVNFIIWLLNRILMTKELVNDPLAVYKIVANETNNVDVALEVQKVFPSKKLAKNWKIT